MIGHEMKLNKEPFEWIKNGTKIIELRLFDEKRKSLNIGDTIKFTERDNQNNYIEVTIVGLIKFKTFDEAISSFDIKLIANDKTTKKDLLKLIDNIYTKEEQDKYEKLAILIEKRHQ